MTSKDEDFSAWYNDVIEDAGLLDKRYPVKGMDTWRPHGMDLRNLVDEVIHGEMEATGHDEYEFPLLVPRDQFQKEADHIEGFDAEVFWVTKGGRNELEVPLLLRPTSETAMYPLFALWIRAHTDLPFKTYQIVNTFRYETKHTRSFIRVREIHFFEAHTAHRDYDSAEEQILEDLEILERVQDALCLPMTLCERPEWDKFPGAHYTIGADVLMPDLRTLQLASVHHYATNFAEPYEIEYEDEDGEFQNVHQTTYGMSERLIGALVGVHGDDQGLRLPPAVAPQQVVVVPVIFDEDEEAVLEACEDVRDELEAAGLRVHLDDRDETAGFKYNDWEQKGVPLRVEVGPRDLENDNAVLVPRDGRSDDVEVDSEHATKLLDGSKVVVDQDDVVEAAREQLDAFATRLREDADRLLGDNQRTVKTLEEAKEQDGVLRTWWCGDVDCAETLDEDTTKDVMGSPRTVEDGEIVPADTGTGGCVVCGEETDHVIYMARAY
jgi:prolyl-tRNA synthetase